MNEYNVKRAMLFKTTQYIYTLDDGVYDDEW